MGIMFPKAVETFREYDRTVNVKGLCEKEVMADKVIWPLEYKIMGDDIQTIYRLTDRNNKIVKKFLKAGGIADEEISVSIPSISDKYASEYGQNNRQYRYISKNVITVCSDKVEQVLKLMESQGELLKDDIVISSESWENKPEFKYESLNEIKPEMIEEATKNGREAAEKFAKDSDSRLGKIKCADQGTFTIVDRDSNTPHIKKVRVVSYITYYLNN